MGLRVADYDAMNMKLFLLDNSLYFTCPELTGNHLLGINTETLSQDLPDANIEESENFNYFEMISEHTDENGKFTLSADTLKAMKDAYDAMSDASTWATAEETELTVADISGKCKTYTLTIPAEEARNFLLNMMTAFFNDDYCSNKTECVLLNREYNRLLVLEESLSNIEMLWDAFAEKNIPLVDFGRLVEEKKDVSPYLNALGRIERNYYSSMLSEIETVENLSKEETGIDITKTRRKMRWLAAILLLADVAAFILEAKPMACIASLVLLVPYGVYIHYYPYIYVENKTEQGKEKMIKLPISGPVFAIFLLIGYLEYFNYNFGTFLMMTSVFAAILYVPYMIKSKKTELPQSAGRKASVFLAAFVISFVIMIPMNFVLTFDKPTHEMVYVTDKRISTSRHGSDYMLSVDLNGEEVEFDVSRKLYDKTDIGAVRVVCTKRSIIGFQYSSLHA